MSDFVSNEYEIIRRALANGTVDSREHTFVLRDEIARLRRSLEYATEALELIAASRDLSRARSVAQICARSTRAALWERDLPEAKPRLRLLDVLATQDPS
jgi:hypothetical protein